MEDAPLQDGDDAPTGDEASPEQPSEPEAIEVEGVKMTFEKPADTQLDLF